MSFKPGDTFKIRFSTHNPSTGAAKDAESTPTATLVRNGDNTGETVTVANVTTGDYSAAGTIPSGWDAGDEVSLLIVATVENDEEVSITGRTVVSMGVLDLRVDDIESDISDIKTNTDRVDGLIEDDDGDRFTAKALEEAGGAGDTDWTSTERQQIRHRLGIDGSAAAPTTGTPSLALEATAQDIKTATDRLDGLIEDSDGDRFTAKALEEAATADTSGIAAAVWSNEDRTITGLEEDAIDGDSIASSAVTKLASGVWDRLTSSLTTAGSIGKFVMDRLGLITSTTQIITSGPVSTGDVLKLYKGGSRTGANAITFHVPEDYPLDDWRSRFGLKKLVTTTGTNDAMVSGGADVGGENNIAIFELSAATTFGFAVDTLPIRPLATVTGRAYAWTFSVNNGHDGEAQAGTSTTITLASTAALSNGFYTGRTITIRKGEAEEETRTIAAYDGSTKQATVNTAWTVNPSGGDDYSIVASECPVLAEGQASVSAKHTDCK